jgi:hypothetical protein
MLFIFFFRKLSCGYAVVEEDAEVKGVILRLAYNVT